MLSAIVGLPYHTVNRSSIIGWTTWIL